MIANRSKTLNRVISYVTTLGFVSLVLYFSKDQWYQVKNLSTVNVVTVFWLSILSLLIEVINGYRLKVIVRIFGTELKAVEWFGLNFVQALGNYLPFNAGVVSNAVYLKHRKKLPVTQFLSYTIGSTVILMGTYGVLSTLLLLIRYSMNHDLSRSLFLVSIGVGIFGMVVTQIRIPEIMSNSRIFGWIISIEKGWRSITVQRDLVLKIIVLHTINLVLLSLRYVVVFYTLPYEIDILAIIVLTSMTTLIRFTSIVPGNLGLRESISGGAAKSFGLTFGGGVLAAVINRIVEMFWIFLLGIICSFVLINNRTNNSQDGRSKT